MDIRHADHRGTGADTGDGHMKYDRNELIVDSIGIALMVLVIVLAVT